MIDELVPAWTNAPLISRTIIIIPSVESRLRTEAILDVSKENFILWTLLNALPVTYLVQMFYLVTGSNSSIIGSGRLVPGHIVESLHSPPTTT